MKRRIAAVAFALALMAGTGGEPEPSRIEIVEDGTPVHRPTGLRLPRGVRGPDHSYNAIFFDISPGRVRMDYGPVTVLIIRFPSDYPDVGTWNMPVGGWLADADAPALPALLFQGEAALPEVKSYTAPPGYKWLLSATIKSPGFDAIRPGGFLVEISALYEPEHRETVVRAIEAVWATLAAANTNAPR